MNPPALTRRQLLAGAASAGAASIAGLAAFTGGSRAFTDTVQLQTGSVEGLHLDWRETYNGSVRSNTIDGTTSPSPTGPAISLGNVLPGDRGSLSVRVRLEPADGSGEDAGSDGTDSGDDLEASIALTLALTGELQSPGLQDFLEAAVWYDTGLLDVDAFGARNGALDPGENLVHPDAEGTLGEVAGDGSALADGVVLDSSPNAPGDSPFLSVGDAVTTTFAWAFPTGGENVNAVQGDAVNFDVHFHAEQC